jgi:hypothetical protein
MADAAAPPPPGSPASFGVTPDIVKQVQSAGEQEYQQAVARGNELYSTRGPSGLPPPPAESEVSAPEFNPNAPPPPPPTAAEAAAPPGSKPGVKPVKVTKPTQEEIDKANHEPTVGDFMHALVQGQVPELTGIPGRMGASTAHGIAYLGGGVVAPAIDHIWDAMTGVKTVDKKTGTIDYANPSTHVQDAVFNFDKNYIQPAVEYWTPKRGSFIGDEGSGAVAQGVAGGLEMLSYAKMGVPGIAAMTGNAFTKSLTDNLDKGMTGPQAYLDATIDSLATIATMRFIGSDALRSAAKVLPTAAIRRALTSVPVGQIINLGRDLTKKMALEMTGNDKDAARINIADSVTSIGDYVQNALYAILFPQHQAPALPQAAEGAPPPPKPSTVAAPELKPGQGEPPPPPADTARTPEPATPAPHSTVPDTPSAEPARQIRAQLIDMNRANTPRVGVLISPETQAHLDSLPADHEHSVPIKNQIDIATKQGRTVDTPAGLLITKTKNIAAKAKGQLGAGEDPQAVIGRITGAGEGKTPDQTVVVQGREITDGSITSEKAVRPDQQGAAVQGVMDQGKVPIIVTPDGVLNERHLGVTEEKQTAVEQQPAAPEKTAPPAEAAPAEKAAPAPSPEAEKPTKGFFKTDSGKEVPVSIAGEPVEGKVTVHPLDEEGEPGPAIQVPADRIRTGQEIGQTEEVAPSETKEPQQAAGGTALDQLPAALAAHEKQETATAGRKNPASLKERQDNASAFAKVLRQAAVEAHEKGAPEAAVERATESAKRAEGLTQKSKEATEKGQGTSHAIVTARTAEMHKAARELLGKPRPGDEERVSERKPVKPVKPLAEKPSKATAEKPSKAPEPAGKVATEKETRRLLTLRERYLSAESSDEANKAADELERHITEVASRLGRENPREEAQAILRHLSEERKQSGRRISGRLSDTLEDEEQAFDRPETGFTTVYRPSVGGKAAHLAFNKARIAVKQALHNLGNTLAERGFFDRMLRLQDTGTPASLHDILDQMSQHASPDLQDMIKAVRDKAPDAPVFSRSYIVNPETAKFLDERTQGLFYRGTRTWANPAMEFLTGYKNVPAPSIQIRFQNTLGYPHANILHAIIHEAWHTATEYEITRNPKGALASQLQQALDILRQRLSRKYGADVIKQHLEAFTAASVGGKAAIEPGDLRWHLYGLSNISEMLSELGSRPDFVQEVIESENYAHPSDEVPDVKGIPGLLAKIYTAIANFLNIKPKLLLHMLDLQNQMAEAQRGNREFAGMYGEASGKLMRDLVSPAISKAMAQSGSPVDFSINALADRSKEELEELFQPAPPVKAEGVLRAMAGNDEIVKAGRENIHVMSSKAVDMVRSAVTALKTVGQIFRDHVSAFGHDDDTNPINQLRDIMGDRNKLLQDMRKISNPVAKAWMRLNSKDNMEVSQLMIDTTQYKIDPRQGAAIPAEAQARPGFSSRLAEYRRRYTQLSDEARKIYDDATDANKKLRGMERRAAVDAAAEGFGLDLSDGQKRLLYSAKNAAEFESLIGEGKLVDVGDKNEKLTSALRDWVGSQMEGPYHHLGRVGEYVVRATPEGTKEFGDNKARAEEFAVRAREMSPNSKAEAEERGGQWVVDYKVEHVSMHESRTEAEKAQAVLHDSGFDVGKVTMKTYDREQAGALSSGMRELMTEAIRKITRSGHDEGTDALTDALHSAFLQMQAQRSAYAGSRLMRKNIGGVKAKDMRRNFAEHASGSIWHAAHVRTVFRQAAAMSRLREMAKSDDAPQAVMYKRNEVVKALNAHAANEVASMSKPGGNFNARMAKLGFLAYLTSPAHAAVWLTQNFTTGVPWAGARYGYSRSTAAFAKGMAAVTGPSMKSFMHEVIRRGGSSDEIHAAAVRAIAAHPQMGKWADAIRQLGERGVISHGYANELAEMARGTNPSTTRVMEWARLLPAMADAINRTSTALAGLELTGGDLRKTADMVETIHADYSAGNKPLAFKALGRFPGANSITMFKTYAQEMIHLTYGNLITAMKGLSPGGDKQAAWIGAKTVAGIMVGNAMFAGVYGAVALEPLRFMLYAYHKLFDEEGEVWDLKNSIHHFLVDHFGAGVGNVLARGPIASALGVDVQSRIGLSDLFFHDPPDLMTTDKTVWSTFISNELGPGIQLLANNATTAAGHIQSGEYAQAIAGLVPVKMWQDGLKALQMMQTGKQNARGVPVTQPSASDALKQMFGLKPESVAEEQEKAGIKSETRKVQGATKGSIIKELLSYPEGSAEREEARARLRAFNKRNPGAEITPREVHREAIGRYKTEHEVPTKNIRAEQAADFSGVKP